MDPPSKNSGAASDVDLALERLMRSAAQASPDAPVAAPFGFETRVVALWRASGNNGNGLARFLRRVALVASAVIVISTAAAVREYAKTLQRGEPLTNEFAIADSVIQDEVLP